MHNERFDPRDPSRPPHVVRGHRRRYEQAASYVQESGCKNVVDAACGLGHGAVVLAEAAPNVLGVDRSAEAIRECEARHSGHAGVSFHQADLRWWDPGKVDAVVCIDTIEHLEQPQQFVVRMQRAASLFVLAWPFIVNKNPYHISLIYPKEVMRWFRKWNLLYWQYGPESNRHYLLTVWEKPHA